MQSFRMPFKTFNNNSFYERTARKFPYSSIVIVGCGGSGSNIALALTTEGLQNITLIDDDILEHHNLNRTPYRIKDIGSYKAIALADIIQERRSDVDVKIVCKKVGDDATDWNKLFSVANLIIDCTDSFDFKMKYFNAVESGKIWLIPYLKVGYDGNMYDIDGSNEYVFNVAGNEGYTIVSTSYRTTLQIASKVVILAEKILDGEISASDIKILGDIGAELGLTLDETGKPEIKIQTRKKVAKRTVREEDEEDFEFVIYDTSERVEETEEQEEQMVVAPQDNVTVEPLTETDISNMDRFSEYS